MRLPNAMRPLLLILICALSTGCAVALGPGFSQPTRVVEVSATSIEPTHIHIQVTDTLENVGNRGLDYLDVTLPGGPIFGTGDVGVAVEGKTVAIGERRQEPGSSLRVPFVPEWPQGETREITFHYDLEPAREGRGVVATTSDGFYLASPNVFPFWETPLGPFARGSLRAHTEELEVTVPADFRVLALVREQRSTRRGELVVHRFVWRGAAFPPYLIAGRYRERRIETQQGSFFFWTREPIDEAAAQMAADHLSATAAIYERLFGKAADNHPPIYIVETSAELAAVAEATGNIAAASFPEGVLLDHDAVRLGVASEPVLDLADYELAHTWFGWHVLPQPQAELLLGQGMALCASILAAEARGGPAGRQRQIAQFIATYDRVGSADKKAGFGPASGYTREEVRAKTLKAALFLISLEDVAGAEKFDRAVRRILKVMAGREIGSDELRSAVEAETGQNLAPLFHAWLDRPGIPADFRTRYAGAQ
jgi:hypothetical protein